MLLPYIPPDPPAPNPSVHTIRVHPLSQSTNHHKLTSSQPERSVLVGLGHSGEGRNPAISVPHVNRAIEVIAKV